MKSDVNHTEPRDGATARRGLRRHVHRGLTIAVLVAAATGTASGTALAKPDEPCRFLKQVYGIQSAKYEAAKNAGDVNGMIFWRNRMWDTGDDMGSVGC